MEKVLTFESTRFIFLAAGNVQTGSENRILTAASDGFQILHLLVDLIGSILYTKTVGGISTTFFCFMLLHQHMRFPQGTAVHGLDRVLNN